MRIAFIFPGQGSQIQGMGIQFYENYATARHIFDTSDEVLGESLSKLCFEGPQSDLNLTANTQPALLTVSAAIAGVIRENITEEISFTAGHSLGEYTALWFSGSLSFESVVKLVRARGKAMQKATPQGMGSMAAVLGLSAEVVEEVCRDAAEDQVLSAANFNGPGQIVVSGHKEAVERAAGLCKEKGARRSVILPVSAPFHCALMEPAAITMAKELAEVDVICPSIPVVSNVTADILPGDTSVIRDSLVRQITSPVMWEQSVRFMADRGVDTFVEIGSGRVLSNLVKRIVPGCKRFTIENPEGMNKFIDQLHE